jgi:iron complex outermembrane receptor protein
VKKLFFIAALFGSITLFAQKTFHGKVVDAISGAPLSSATITFQGKGGTTSDKDGFFFVDCSKTTRVTISSIGYESVQQAIKNCDEEVTIKLSPLSRSLNEVEITTTSAQNKSILYQPSSITKLSPVELKRGTGLFLDDAINANVPGVTMNRRAVSSGQQLNIRGYGNGSRGTRGISSNFDGQGYKVYLNGIPVTDAEGITVLDDIDFGSVGNVEVVKGPSGTLYGLAIAGVVNLKTIKPESGKTSVGQDVLIGNYGLQRYTTHFMMGGQRSSILLNYGHQKSDGFTIHNASHKNFVNFAGDFQPNQKQAINTYFGYSNSYDERSGELTIQQYESGDYSGNIEYIKRNAHSQVYSFRAGVGHTYNFNNNFSNTTTVFGTGFNSNASSAGGWTDKAATNIGLRSSFETRFPLANGMLLSGITGLETQRQNATTIGYGMIKNPLDPNAVWAYGNPYYWIIGGASGSNTSNGETSNVYATTATTSLFSEWTLSLLKDLSITAGIGASNMKIHLDDRFFNPATPNKTRSYDTVYKWMFSPHIALNKVFSRQFSVYASYNQSYKAPVSSYFFIPYTVISNNYVPNTGIINSSLKPEKAEQIEIGTKGALIDSRLTYQLAFFDIMYNNKMSNMNVLLNPTTTGFSYVVNAGKEDHKGIEALLKFTAYQSASGFFKTVSPFFNFTYSDFEYKDYPFHLTGTINKDSIVNYNGHKVAGVPKFMGNAGIDFMTKPGIYGNVIYMYKDGFPITSDGIYNTSSYGLLNAKLGYRNSLSGHFDLDAYFGVNNITGTKYPIMVFVNQIPDAYIAAPRDANYFGGLSLKFIF